MDHTAHRTARPPRRHPRPPAGPATLLALALLGVAAAVAAQTAPAEAPCPAPQAPVLERFLSADCADCWAQPAPEPAALASGAGASWRFDWIVPGHDDAPLSAAALHDSQERLARLGQRPPAGTLLQVQAAPLLPPAQAPALRASLGPAWLGRTMALEFVLTPTAALPTGSSGWLAMVELLPAGTDGSPVARALVRNLAGPLPLDSAVAGQPLSHLRAMRWPETADPTRLQARAWVEGPDGQMLAIAADRCP